MKKEEFINLGIDAAIAEKAAAASAEELKAYVPKAAFDEMKAGNDSLDARLKDYEKQLETLKKSTGDAETMKKQIEQLQADNKAEKEKFAAENKQLRIDNAVNAALSKAGAKSVKAAKALLDLKDADIDDAGEVKGLSKQIKKLMEAEDTAFLFGTATDMPKLDKDGNPISLQVKGGAPAPASNNDPKGSVSIGAQMAENYNKQFEVPKGAK